MSKVLESYLKLKVNLTLEMADRPNLFTFQKLQEVHYRISVFETMQMIYRASKMMAYTKPVDHYKMFDGYVRQLISERMCSSSKSDVQAKRETAYKALQSVVADYRKKFASYVFKNGCDYIDDISAAMNSFLSVWLAHRNTYVEIKEN